MPGPSHPGQGTMYVVYTEIGRDALLLLLLLLLPPPPLLLHVHACYLSGANRRWVLLGRDLARQPLLLG